MFQRRTLCQEHMGRESNSTIIFSYVFIVSSMVEKVSIPLFFSRLCLISCKNINCHFSAFVYRRFCLYML